MVLGSSRPMFLVAALGLAALVSAKSQFGEACSQSNAHLDAGSFQLLTDCDPTLYCADNSTCAYKGCRKDTYPFGYNDYLYDQLPPLCPEGQFCPDEADQCKPQVAIGEGCQKDRDDECQRPPNYKDLAGYLNTNGTACLNFTCYLADVTLGQTCVNDNTPYTAYNDEGAAYAFIVSRDNCANGLYCDGTELKCMKSKLVGAVCSGNKECLSYNCDNSKCGKAADAVVHPPSWQYVLIGLGILILIGGVMTGLWLMHRRSRKENQIKLEQYYNEQIAYRQSIMSMSHAKNSLLSLPPNTSPDFARQSLYRDNDAGWSSATDGGLVPPNMRRDSTSGWSDSDKPTSNMAQADSEVLLMPDQRYADAPESSRRFR
ncbi:hypothetical protein CI109_104896 [Kwoniella shandongensis]|uniref:Uncharacterized protein n=1 Tax=Kwoniella shandongensis TaxID=1734106 RepID=A0A5M6BQ85_9TREE|nr:uncharacterized protein CI109_006615 [Kwoniella shandongensis]KAA5525064.1 hypothetical protein CI109_006615 [Kwoniella shandongensis]